MSVMFIRAELNFHADRPSAFGDGGALDLSQRTKLYVEARRDAAQRWFHVYYRVAGLELTVD